MNFKIYIIGFICFIIFFKISAQNVELWGTTSRGGKYGGGVIFKTNANDDYYSVEHSFMVENQGANPVYTQLCEASNDKLYGLTNNGGIYDSGVLFEYDPSTNKYEKKIDFDKTNLGGNPNSSLIQASDGKLYGTCNTGGRNGSGTLFQYDIDTELCMKKIDFHDHSGSLPVSSLIEASNGKLYGTTSSGGIDFHGILYEYDIHTENLIVKEIFDGEEKGSFPRASLFQASNGKLYGTTINGGTDGKGIIFEYDIESENFLKKFDFDGINGAYAFGSLIEVSSGLLYGMTNQGGASNDGVLFQFNVETDEYTKLLEFNGEINGKRPNGNLIKTSDGKYYGLTREGGVNNQGTLFEYDPDLNQLTKKNDFERNTNGSFPTGNLIEASNGKLYGLTYHGGINNMGTLFEYDINSLTKKIDLNITKKGGFPQTTLVKGTNDKLYGLVNNGGEHGKGVFIEYDPDTQNYTILLNFDGSNNGGLSLINNYTNIGGLINVPDNKLFGLTQFGGLSNVGTLFEYNYQNKEFTKLIDFDNSIGVEPIGSLIKVTANLYYGATKKGGNFGAGVLFEFDTNTGAAKRVMSFNNQDGGGTPNEGLILASNNKIYGTTLSGGTNYLGILFEYDWQTQVFRKLYDYNIQDGYLPFGGLAAGSNNKVYGMTAYGGLNSVGVLFEYDPAIDLYEKVLDFEQNSSIGNIPVGSLVSSPDGKLYGVTTYEEGTLFSYDPVSNEFAKKRSFKGSTGAKPIATLTAIEVDKLSQSIEFVSDLVATYGDASVSVNGTSTSGLALSFTSSNPDIASVTGTEIVVNGAGKAMVTVNQSGNDQYKPAPTTTQELIVNKASLTITADDQTMNRGDALPGLSMSFTGLVNDDTSDDLTLPTISTEATLSSPVGDYSINLDGGESENYEITLVNGMLKISEVLGLSDIDKNTLTPYPNPAISSFKINEQERHVQEIMIYDLNGNLVKKFQEIHSEYDINSLSKGAYIMYLQINNKVFHSKLIKK